MLEGKKVNIKSAFDAMSMGITYCTEDRKECGIIPTMNIRENISIAFLNLFKNKLAIDQEKEITKAYEQVDALNIKTPSLNTKIINLSGGNQQKVLLARKPGW